MRVAFSLHDYIVWYSMQASKDCFSYKSF